MDRRITLAKSYVEGLETLRSDYRALQADHIRLNHEALTLASHNLILQLLMREVVKIPEDDLTMMLGDTYVIVADEVLNNVASLMDEIYSCPCGHSKFDHTEEGCAFLHCRKVCQ